MNTRFGRFLQGRFFLKLFLFLHAASAAFLAFENGRAAGCLLGAGAQWVVTVLFAAAGAVTRRPWIPKVPAGRGTVTCCQPVKSSVATSCPR